MAQQNPKHATTNRAPASDHAHTSAHACTHASTQTGARAQSFASGRAPRHTLLKKAFSVLLCAMLVITMCPATGVYAEKDTQNTAANAQNIEGSADGSGDANNSNGNGENASDSQNASGSGDTGANASNGGTDGATGDASNNGNGDNSGATGTDGSNTAPANGDASAANGDTSANGATTGDQNATSNNSAGATDANGASDANVADSSDSNTQNSPSNAISELLAQQETSALNALAAVRYSEDPYSGTCRINGTKHYYATLDDAIEDIKDTGGTIDIYKDTSISSSHEITSAITIKNITDPGELTPVNPTKNGSAHAQPVTGIANSGQLIVKGNSLTLEGVIFDGNNISRTITTKISAGTTAVEHSVASPIVVQSGSVAITEGAAGTDDVALPATATQFTNFTVAADGGGVFSVLGGDVSIMGGTFSNNTTSGSGGVFGAFEAGVINISAGTFSGNQSPYGGVICAVSGNDGNVTTTNITAGTFTGNTATTGGGGVAFLGTASVMNLSGGTFTQNTTSNTFGAAIDVNHGTLNISGAPKIENNVAADNGAVYVDPNNGKITLEGSPRIVNNNGHNLSVGANGSDKLVVNAAGLGSDARIGISNLVASGTDFCTTTNTFATTPYMACFSNDTNTTLIPAVSSTTATKKAKWIEAKSGDNDYVCYITDSNGITTYYTSLNAAIDGRNALADANATIEIFKSHNFSAGGATAAEKTLTKITTIKNVNNPLNNAVDWTQVNGNTAPVVTFSNSSDRIVFSVDGYLEGISFTGNNINRTTSAVGISNGHTLRVVKQENGQNVAGTNKKISTANYADKFINTSGVNAKGGGFLCIDQGATAYLNNLEACNCNSYGNSSWVGGGSIALCAGELYINGGNYHDCKYRGNVGYYSEAPFCITTTGNCTIDGGYFHDNTGSCGGVVQVQENTAGAGTLTVKGDALFENNTAGIDGGAIFTGAGSTIYLQGNATFKSNSAARSGGAVHSRYITHISGNVLITGNSITSDATGRGGGIGSCNATKDRPIFYISGSPRIYGNTSSKGDEDLGITAVAGDRKLIIIEGEIGKDAHIGYYDGTDTMYQEGNVFATANVNPATGNAGISGAFFNNRDSDLFSQASSDSTDVVWSKAVVKESKSDGTFVKYYDSLNNALAGVTSGNTLEILKTHTLTGNAELAAGKTCYIRNIVNPTNDTENPFKDTEEYVDEASGETKTRLKYDASDEPVVYFAKSDTAYRLTISGTCTCEGVKFSGQSWTGVDGAAPDANSRTSSGVLVNAGATLTINNGVAGRLPDTASTADPNRPACETVIENFVNDSTDTGTTTANESNGGFVKIFGTVNMKGGTVQNCVANPSTANHWVGGGSAAAIMSGGTFNMYGGTITSCGSTDGWTGGAFYIYPSGTFYMNGGKVTNNKGQYGGMLYTPNEDSNTSQITIEGGEISNNWSQSDGGAIFAGGGNVTVSGGTFKNNFSPSYGSAIAMRAQTKSLTISGGTFIGNTSTSASAWAVGGRSSTDEPTLKIYGSPVIYDNGQVAAKGDTAITKKCNLFVGTVAHFTVGTMSKNAKVGVYNTDGNINASGKAFSTDTAGTDATNCGYVAAFYNDVNNDTSGQPLRGTDSGNDKYIYWGSVIPTVKVTETVTTTDSSGDPVYTDVVHTFGGTTAIADAFACVASLPTGNVVAGTGKTYAGYFPIECLVSSYSQTATCTISAGADRPIIFTTASSNADDGYSYSGTAGTNAVVKRGANFGSMFKIDSSSKVTVKNLTMNGTGGREGETTTYKCTGNKEGGGFFRVSAGTLTLDDGSVLKNSVMTDKDYNNGANYCPGTAIFTDDKSAKVVMTGNANITNCKGRSTVYIDYGSLEMGGTSSITNCDAVSQGAAINLYNVKLTMKDEAKITGCTSPEQSAISGDGSTIYLQDKVEISGNTTSYADKTEWAYAAISDYGGTGSGNVYLSGSVKIYNNKDSNGNQVNLHERRTANFGTYITVQEAGLTKDAMIGVYSDNTYSAGDTFARTEAENAAQSTNATFLSKFINDKDSSLYGTAGEENRVIWTKMMPVNIIIEMDQAASVDTYFTLQIQGASTGQRSRVAVCVPAGQKKGNVYTLQPAGQTGSVANISGGSAYGYTLGLSTPDEPTQSYLHESAVEGVTVDTSKDYISSSVSFLCFLTLSADCDTKGQIKTTEDIGGSGSGMRELKLKATLENPDTPALLANQSKVTNTMQVSKNQSH